MEKPTIYLIIVIILCFTVLGVAGEYFAYKYYALVAAQPAPQTAINTAPNSASSATSTAAATQPPPGSSENSIISFDFQSPVSAGRIDESSHTVTVTVPSGTDVTKLAPTIEISKDAAILPSSGVPQDFTGPVAYLVTAQNGSTQEYIAVVNVAANPKSVEKLIKSFKISGVTPEADGSIDNIDHTIFAIVPDGTDITKLAPAVSVSEGATLSPKSGTSQDFTGPVIYTVTDSYGGTQSYTATVVTKSNGY